MGFSATIEPQTMIIHSSRTNIIAVYKTMSNSELRNRIFQGHIIEALQRFPDQSVHTIVSSPPYYGLRNYDIPKSVWGGRTDCDHAWTNEAPRLSVSTTSNTGGKYCRKCGAWLGCLGEEPEIEMYIEHLHSVCKRQPL